MNSFFRKLAWLTGRKSKEDELADELRFHLDEEAEKRQDTGLAESEARAAARRELGNLISVKEETRAAWSWTLLDQFLQDLQYAARAIARSPAFTLLAALSLALGIGASTAIYSFMDALLMRSLPVANPDSLVVLNWHVTGKKTLRNSVLHNVEGFINLDRKTGLTSPIFPYPAFELLSSANRVFSATFAYRPARKLNILAHGQAEVTNGEYVSGDYFNALEIVPAAGRLIAAHDDRAGAPAVAVFSYGYARSRFGDYASAVEKQVLIDNVPFTIIGVGPPSFFGVDPAKAPDFYLPLHADLLIDPHSHPGSKSHYLDEHYYWAEIMGRLRPGVTREQAQTGLAPIFGRWVASTATTESERNNLPELLIKDGATGLDNLRREYSDPLFILLAMVGLILALACANIANLLLTRATGRRREIAVRLSIGAGPGRVIRQLMTESLVLASLGGVAGVLFAIWGVRLLTLALSNGNETFPQHAELNLHVLLAASALTIVTGFLFGLAPALQATRVDPIAALKSRGAADKPPRGRLRVTTNNVLAVSQMAICLLLLVGAGLFVRTLLNLQSRELGFQRDNILLFRLNARQAGHQNPEIFSFYRSLEKNFAAIPGVLSETMANAPLIGNGAWGWPVVAVGKPKPENAASGYGSGAPATDTRVLGTGPGFFTTMHIPLLEGREFGQRDAGGPPVAIVNEAWAKFNLDGADPVGRHVLSYGLRSEPQEMEIVGLAKNARYGSLTGEFPAVVYLPLSEKLDLNADDVTFFLRTASDPGGFVGAVRQIIHQTDPRIPVTNLQTQSAQIDGEMTQQKLLARLCTAFALLALAIACVGLYGMMSYTVARRTGEIGIRIALGAERGTVVSMVLRHVAILAAVGIAISVPTAVAVARFIESFLFRVKPADPFVIAAASAIIMVSALLAGYLPARTASRIDPMVAVRQE